MLRITGDLAGAERCLDEVLELRPDDAEAWLLRSGLRRWSLTSEGGDNHVVALRAALARAASGAVKARVQLGFALAKELEDCAVGADDAELLTESFAVLRTACALRRQHIQYDIADDLATLTALRDRAAQVAPLLTAAATRSSGARPIFVVSLPRAGSTLLERMLGCAEGVHLAGELNQFPAALGQELKRTFIAANPAGAARPPRKAELVGLTDALDFAAMGAAYRANVPSLPAETRAFVDKLPLNLLNIEHIFRALPDAHIVYVRRQREDHCYAILKQLFAQAYPWSYSTDECCAYYDAVTDMMQPWLSAKLPRLHVIDYEELVQQPETTSRALFDALDLTWTPAVLDFHRRNSSASTTASAAQVRQPLTSRSIGLGQRFFAG
ncbi:sulfotransferase family protein [Pseudidiomarina aestuarii]|uniref:sulfotransferase family protein n=1 Tax=Pseudidiomarina aestuarii TaxID=624146 RepID=UPI003A97DEB3